jgi:hypothetical protein
MAIQECKYVHGPQEQSTTEECVYILDTTGETEDPTSPVVDYVWDLTSGTDVKATVMPAGSPSVTNNEITLPVLKLLTLGKWYRVELHYGGANGARLEKFFTVFCNRQASVA